MEPHVHDRIDAYVRSLGETVALADANDPAHDPVKASYHEVAHIGGAPGYWLGADEPLDLADTGGEEPVFVCFYTLGTGYRELAARLEASLDRFGLDHRIVGVEPLGSWERNCAMKARFVRDQWRALGRPVVWLDADATVEADPVTLRRCGADFAIAKTHGWEFGSGTIFFGATPAAGRLLDRWVLRCEADPLLWDQMHLDAAWADIAASEPLVTQWLPQSYLFIFDHPPERPPVITHWQASRTHKASVSGGTARPKPDIPAGLQEARRFSRFSRSIESLFWGVEGTAHIKPEVGIEHPEGFDVPATMREIAAGALPLLEIGCGIGRIAAGFAPDEYIGVDINPNALLAARRALPVHDFRLVTEELGYPAAGTALFYTVLLHVPDEALDATLAKATAAADRVVIAEIMDRRWRRAGDPPVFNREAEDYVLAMRRFGFDLTGHARVPYAHYDNERWWSRRDTRLAMLVFERARRG